jgi:Zn finger protein HypA/HybF involved in hydrogenase expression
MITVGGNRADYRTDSAFPFYCRHCGIADVNITEGKLFCPRCGSSEVLPYGKEPISIEPVEETFPRLMNDDYEAYEDGNLCPKCNTKNMKFGGVDIYLD